MSRVEYSVVCADPAWRSKDQLPGKGRGASKHYKTMTTEQICDLAHVTDGRNQQKRHTCDIELRMSGRRARIADSALLALWRLGSMQTDALEVCRSWGFVDKAEVVWVKYRPCVDCQGIGKGVGRGSDGPWEWVCKLCDGTGCGTPWFGMGRYTRGAHETCLIAARGRMASQIQAHNIRSVLHAPVPWNWDTNRAIHSAKPEIFYTDIIERLAKGPYLELFGRRRRRGWTVLGNQVGKYA